MSSRVTFTLDVEDHRPDASAELRFHVMTRRVLEFCAARDIRASVFVVGSLVDEHADLVREIAAAGHELGLHAWEHVPLAMLDRATFREHARRGKERLEDVGGGEVAGYRAPTFSLVPESAWATDVLADLGFRYSSSVLPARNPLYSWPGSPTEPFRWPSGLLEFPAPVLGPGRFSLPVLGGVYFRVLPLPVARAGLRLGRARDVPWLYCHPYDFDPDEVFWVVPDSGRWGSRLLWLNRRRMFSKVERFLADRAGPPLVERLEELGPAGDLPLFEFDTAEPGAA